ncbi:TMV resistance protein N-like isoform X1 [Senna tora]|uniref:TMV resistance protein N-like isoform X1 n=1 Tax=Senna tora TaxID=362788 RepID=A0A834W8U6_9FABA|nr:TMV resistance protein N-like isoform X1 [Senna tora]
MESYVVLVFPTSAQRLVFPLLLGFSQITHIHPFTTKHWCTAAKRCWFDLFKNWSNFWHEYEYQFIEEIVKEMIRLFLVTFKGTDEVEVIILKSVNNNGYNVQWDGKAFEKMKKLKRFMDFSVLNFDSCEGITEIPDISCLPNLRELSFMGCVNLVEVHDSVGSLGKLRILRACFCPNLRTLPPLAMSTLEKLRLQNCSSLEAFPDILGEKKKITELDLHDTDLVFPSSIQNLTGVRILDMQNCRRIQLPVHIAMLPELELLHIRVCRELQFSKQDEGIEKGSSIMCPKMDRLVIGHCNISDESLLLCLSWFVNVKTLNLQGSNFTILPACINKCRFLTSIDLENCKRLQEIRGLPPNIEHLSAKNCTSLSSQSTSILLSELRFDPHVIINGNKRFHAGGHGHPFDVKADHIFVFDLRSINFRDKVEDASLEKDWNYVEISYENASFSDLVWRSHKVSIEEVRKESGIYVLKEINQMEDIRFTNPYMDNEICSHAPSEAMISGLDSTMSSSTIRDTSRSYGDDEGNDVMRSDQDDHLQFSLCALISSVVSLCSSS